MSKETVAETAALAAVRRVMAARKEAALAELAYVEIAMQQLDQLELAAVATTPPQAEPPPAPEPRLVVNVDDTPPDAETEPAPDRQTGKVHSEFGALISDELPARHIDPRSRRKAGLST